MTRYGTGWIPNCAAEPSRPPRQARSRTNARAFCGCGHLFVSAFLSTGRNTFNGRLEQLPVPEPAEPRLETTVRLGVTEMHEVVGGPATLDLAIERYKQGKCPCCGKSQREPKGLEYRTRSNDLYCHTCKQRWPMTLDLTVLQRELSLALPSLEDSRSREVFDLTPHTNTGGLQTETRGLRRLLRRIVWRH